MSVGTCMSAYGAWSSLISLIDFHSRWMSLEMPKWFLVLWFICFGSMWGPFLVWVSH